MGLRASARPVIMGMGGKRKVTIKLRHFKAGAGKEAQG